ncbi:MAG: hypothetical protein ACI4FX_01210 [Agathobacter sp.]
MSLLLEKARKDFFAATVSQLNDAIEIYKELEKRLVELLKSVDDENRQRAT